MATATTNTDVQTFFEALQAAPEFDHVEYVNRLKQAMSKTIAMQRLGDYFKPADVGQTDTLFDGLDCSEYVRDLAVATMALEMSNITDQWGFQSNVNQVGNTTHKLEPIPPQPFFLCPEALLISKQDAATAVYRASLAKLIPYLYGDHVNRFEFLVPTHPTAGLPLQTSEYQWREQSRSVTHERRIHSRFPGCSPHAQYVSFGTNCAFLAVPSANAEFPNSIGASCFDA